MIYSERKEGQGKLLVWTSNPANREIYSYVLRHEEDGWRVIAKRKSYKRDHPRFGEERKLEPESTRALKKHVKEEYGITVKN